jgi:hypothetical protein
MKKRDREEKHSRRLEEEIVLDMDWTDPVIDVNRRNKQSEARKKQKLFLCTAMVKRMVIEIVEETPAASAVGMIMKEVVEEAAKTGMTEKIWKELENYEDILQRIVQKVEDRESRKMLEKAEEDRKSRLEKKATKSKEWLERRRMDSVLEGMKCLELGSFEGEWSEHERMDEQMMNTYEHGGRLDEDDAQMKDVENDDKIIAKKDEENVQVNDKSMEFEYNYEQEAVHEHELIQSKTTFLNI